MQYTHLNSNHKMPNYEFHMPKRFTYPLPVSIAGVIVAGLLYFFLREIQPTVGLILSGITFLVSGMYVGIYAVLKRITSLERRLRDRDKLMEEIPWRGDETVLDVGCGNGILTMSAAKRLPSGKVIGTDIWTEGSGDNTLEAFLENAQIEGVADWVEIHNENVLQLSYEDESFDVIISGLTIHHLGFDTEEGIKEMIRVLKPGGWMAIYDEPSTIFFSTKLLQKYGLKVENKTIDMVFGVKL